jgi:hypothetical protein
VLAGLLAVSGATAIFTGWRPSAAAELLANGEFEEWGGVAPAGWAVAGVAAEQVSAPARSGNSVRLSGNGFLRAGSPIAVAGGTPYAASVWVAGGGEPSVQVTLELRWLNADLAPLPSSIASRFTADGFQQLAVVAQAPLHAATVELRIYVDGGVAYLDSASLDGASPPTTTPLPTSAPTTVGPPPTATRTPTAAATATLTSYPAPAATATHTAGSIPEYGGLIRNGNFERVGDGGLPAFWSKFGGSMGLTSSAHGGQQAATLSSDGGGTWWIHQAAQVSGGQWYRAEAWGRVQSGSGEAFIRVNWYASIDGSGANIGQVDSGIVTGSGWAYMTTGAIQAPPGANSARVRLMLRAEGNAAAAFDDAGLFVSAAATPTPVPPAATSTTPPDVTATRTPTTTRTPSVTRTPSRAPTPRPGGGTAGSSSGGGGGASGGGFEIVANQGPHTLRLSEVMSDAPEPGNDRDYEWVELVNVGAEPVSTAGWRLGDAQQLDALPGVEVPAGGFVVVAGNAAAFAEGVLVIRLGDGSIGNGLSNTGDLVRLIAPSGEQVDAMSYGTNTATFDPPLAAPSPGETLGVRVAGGDPGPENWDLTLRPTPGKANVFFVQPDEQEDQPGTPAAPRTPGAPVGAVGRPQVEEDDDSSPIPWIVLGGALAGGLFGAGALGWRRWSGKLRRLRGR